MKVTGITATPFDIPLPAMPEACLVELRCERGECGMAIAPASARQTVMVLAKELLLGEDVRATGGFWQRAGRRLENRADPGTVQARAALDMAAWDLRARSQSEPLWKTLGGGRPKANVYASYGDSSSGDVGFEAWLQWLGDQAGMRGCKLGGGKDPAQLEERLDRAHQALAPHAHQPALMIDAGGCMPSGEAIELIRTLETKFDLTWVEGVAPPGDFRAARKVSDSVRGAVCAGGELLTLEAFQPWFQHESANVIEIDMRHFGVTGSLQLADAAFGLELPVTLAAMPGNIQAHLSAVMPYFMSMEVLQAEPGDLAVGSSVRLESGWAVAGSEPGFGLSVDRRHLREQGAGQ